MQGCLWGWKPQTTVRLDHAHLFVGSLDSGEVLSLGRRIYDTIVSACWILAWRVEHYVRQDRAEPPHSVVVREQVCRLHQSDSEFDDIMLKTYFYRSGC